MWHFLQKIYNFLKIEMLFYYDTLESSYTMLVDKNAIFKYFWIIWGILDYKFGMEIGRSSNA
jgi:hypothetical protein